MDFMDIFTCSVLFMTIMFVTVKLMIRLSEGLDKGTLFKSKSTLSDKEQDDSDDEIQIEKKDSVIYKEFNAKLKQFKKASEKINTSKIDDKDLLKEYVKLTDDYIPAYKNSIDMLKRSKGILSKDTRKDLIDTIHSCEKKVNLAFNIFAIDKDIANSNKKVESIGKEYEKLSKESQDFFDTLDINESDVLGVREEQKKAHKNDIEHDVVNDEHDSIHRSLDSYDKECDDDYWLSSFAIYEAMKNEYSIERAEEIERQIEDDYDSLDDSNNDLDDNSDDNDYDSNDDIDYDDNDQDVYDDYDSNDDYDTDFDNDFDSFDDF